MATPLICLKISAENVKQLSANTRSAKRSSVSVEGSLTVRWSKKYLSAKVSDTCALNFRRYEIFEVLAHTVLLSRKTVN